MELSDNWYMLDKNGFKLHIGDKFYDKEGISHYVYGFTRYDIIDGENHFWSPTDCAKYNEDVRTLVTLLTADYPSQDVAEHVSITYLRQIGILKD